LFVRKEGDNYGAKMPIQQDNIKVDLSETGLGNMKATDIIQQTIRDQNWFCV
jgi:hypothetical protein